MTDVGASNTADRNVRPDYYLVIDLEATTSDDGSLPREERETIEIGTVLVDGATLQPLDEHQTFVRPVRHPTLTHFCTRLTSISQEMVDGAPLFPVAIAALAEWFTPRGTSLCFASWGEYDRIQLEQDCAFHNLAYPMPRHLNLKARFSTVQRRHRRFGMDGALRMCGLALEGAHHRGIDDARNIARLLPWIVGGLRLPR